MISSLRNKKKLITFSLWFIIAAFVGTIFFVWGVGDKAQEAFYAVKVDKTVVTDAQFRQKVEDTRNQFRQLFGNNIDDVLQGSTIERTVMDTLINEALLRNEAARLEIPVSDAEVAANLQGMQTFQTDGKFDPQLYVQILARNRLIPQIFEESLRQDILLQKIQMLIQDSVAVSDEEINKEFVYQNTEASIRFLELAAEDFRTQVEVTDEALEAFFEEYKEAYRVPAQADFIYTVFDENEIKDEYKATDAEIEDFFVRNKEALKEPAKVSAAHILLKVDNWDDELAANEIYKKAKDIREQIVNGADFAEMAKKYSEDSTAANGGELGYFTKGQMVPEFENAAFSTESGQISEVVKTQFGFHIIKVTDNVAEKDPTLDEARETIASLIEDQKSGSAFRNYVYDIYREILNKSNITAYNKDAEEKLEVHEIKGLTATGNVAPLIGLSDTASRLLAMTKSEVSQVTDVGGLKIIFEMTEKYDSYIPEFADVKDQVAEHFIQVKSLEMAQAKAKEASELGSMDKAANMLKKSYTTTPKFMRNDPISGLGLNPRLMEDIFSSDAEAFLNDTYTVGGNVFIVQVKEITEPDPASITDSQKEQIEAALYGVKSEAALSGYVQNLRSKAKIEVSPRYLEFYQN